MIALNDWLLLRAKTTNLNVRDWALAAHPLLASAFVENKTMEITPGEVEFAGRQFTLAEVAV